VIALSIGRVVVGNRVKPESGQARKKEDDGMWRDMA